MVFVVFAALIMVHNNAFDINAPTIGGFTSLHCATMIPGDFKNTPVRGEIIQTNEIKDWHEIDKKKAQTVSYLIDKGARWDIQDYKGLTPIYYSEKNKLLLPKTYKVMQAAKIKTETIQKYNITKDISIFLNKDYEAALITLKNYLPKNQTTNK
jgi:hypothetical protein